MSRIIARPRGVLAAGRASTCPACPMHDRRPIARAPPRSRHRRAKAGRVHDGGGDPRAAWPGSLAHPAAAFTTDPATAGSSPSPGASRRSSFRRCGTPTTWCTRSNGVLAQPLRDRRQDRLSRPEPARKPGKTDALRVMHRRRGGAALPVTAHPIDESASRSVQPAQPGPARPGRVVASRRGRPRRAEAAQARRITWPDLIPRPRAGGLPRSLAGSGSAPSRRRSPDINTRPRPSGRVALALGAGWRHNGAGRRLPRRTRCHTLVPVLTRRDHRFEQSVRPIPPAKKAPRKRKKWRP